MIDHPRNFPRTIRTVVVLFTISYILDNYRSHRRPDQMREFKHLVSYNANRVWYNANRDVAQRGRPSTSNHKKTRPREPMESGELNTEQRAREMYVMPGDGSLKSHQMWKTDGE